MRECETICKECILNVIRDNMPVEQILRSYMGESIEEEIIEENIINHEEEQDVSQNRVSEEEKEEKEQQGVVVHKSSDSMKDIKTISDVKETEVNDKQHVDKHVVEEEREKETTLTMQQDVQQDVQQKKEVAVVENVSPPLVLDEMQHSSDLDKSLINSEKASDHPVLKVDTPRTLSFNDVDHIYDRETLISEKVSAPKTIERLEEISKIRTAQRKLEDEEEGDDDENIKISTKNINTDLGVEMLT